MKLSYSIFFIPNVFSVKRNNFVPLVPSTSSWRKQFGLPYNPYDQINSQQASATEHQIIDKPLTVPTHQQHLGNQLIASTEHLDNSILNVNNENSSSQQQEEQQLQGGRTSSSSSGSSSNSNSLPDHQTTKNHQNTAEVVRKSDASLIWRRTLAGHVNKIEDNKDIAGYFHVSDSITEALNYYFNYKDQSANNKQKRRRRRRSIESGNVKGEDFIDYGCWCKRVRYLREAGWNTDINDNSLKGGAVLDDIDRVCQDWTKCMRCVSITNSKTFEAAQQDQTTRNFQQSNCQFDKMTFAFGIKTTGELTCSDPSNHVRSCAYQTCMCNLDLIHKITDLRHKFDAENSRYNNEHAQSCRYQKKDNSANSALLSENQKIQSSGLSVVGFDMPDSRSGSSSVFQDDYWSFDYDNTKSEDTDYYDTNPVSVHSDSLSGPRASVQKVQIETQCCGTVPHWRPYKTSNRQCCRKAIDGLPNYWITKKETSACDAMPVHTLR